MVHCIVCDDDICLLHHLVMPDPVLLKSLCIQHCDLHWPHTRDGMQYYLIIPEIPPEHQATVLLERQWGIPTPTRIHLLLNAIQWHQGQELIVVNQLLVVYNVVDHHPPKITVRKIGGPCDVAMCTDSDFFMAVNKQLPDPSTCKQTRYKSSVSIVHMIVLENKHKIQSLIHIYYKHGRMSLLQSCGRPSLIHPTAENEPKTDTRSPTCSSW